MKLLSACIYVLLIALTLSGCQREAEPVAPSVTTAPTHTFPPKEALPLHHNSAEFPDDVRIHFARLHPGDKVLLTIGGDPRFQAGIERTVDPLGRISVPLIGPQPAEGLLPEEFSQQLNEKLKTYYQPPQCETIILLPAVREIKIMGAVLEQGAWEVKPDDTLLGVIARAKGVLERPSKIGLPPTPPREARVIRDQGKAVAIVDLKPLLNGVAPQSDISIKPGDIVQVAAASQATIVVLGEVVTPGPVVLEEGMDIMQVVALAGGPTEDASLSQAVLVRNWWDQSNTEIHKVRLDEIIYQLGHSAPIPHDRDILVIPRNGAAAFNYFLRQITPSLLTWVTAEAVLNNDEDD